MLSSYYLHAYDMNIYGEGNQIYDSSQINFMVRLPRAGFFQFQLYALPGADSTERLPNVFNYLIEVFSFHGQEFHLLARTTVT